MKKLDIDKISRRLMQITEAISPESYYSLDTDDVLSEQDAEEGGVPAEDAAATQELEQLIAAGGEGMTPPPADPGAPATPEAAPEAAPEAPTAPAAPEPAPVPETPEAATSDENEVEVDVTDIVKKVEGTENSVDDVEEKIDNIGNQVNQYIEKLMKVNTTLMDKISELETNMNKQFSKRNPTPHEQLMLRSMSSYPYTQKLSDFWETGKEGSFKPKGSMGDDMEDEEPEEYTLTQEDIENTFNPVDIKKTF
jgi:hypothetical protein